MTDTCVICAAIDAEFTRLGVPDGERPTYRNALEYAAGRDGNVLTMLAECATRADLDKLTEDGIITGGETT